MLIASRVTRRNRFRMIAIGTAALANYTLLAGAIATFLVWARFSVSERSAPGPRDAAIGFGVGAAVAVVFGAWELRSAGRRTIASVGAVALPPGEQVRVDNLLAELALAVGNPPVRSGLVVDPAPNAIAIGTRRSNTTIVVTTGLIELLSRDELEAVLAVQMCSVRRLDTSLQNLAIACSRGLTKLHGAFRSGRSPRTLFIALLMWPSAAAGQAIRRHALRSATDGADDMSITVTRNPQGLERALRKLKSNHREVTLRDPQSAALWFEPITWQVDGRVETGLSRRIARLARR